MNQLCMGKEFHKVTELLIKGTDSHNHGQKTVRCRLDNASEEKQYAMIEGTIPRIMRFVIIKNKH